VRPVWWRHRKPEEAALGMTRRTETPSKGVAPKKTVSALGRVERKRSAVSNDPTHQFLVNKIVPIEIGGIDFSFTNASLFMVATVGVAAGFLYLTTSQRGLIPTRMQSVSEMSYEFIASMLREGAGSGGMKFFPMVFSLFMFILTANLLGMMP